MGQTIANFDAMLKEHYMDKVPEQVNQKVKLAEHFKSRSGAEFSADGRQVTYPLHTGRNAGTGSIGERGQLPTAGAQQYVSMSIPFRFTYGRIEITSQAMKQSMTSKGAFRKAVDEEITRAAKDVGRIKNRQLWGYGSGILAKVKLGVSGVTSFTVYAAGGVDHDSGTGLNGYRFLKVGQNIAFIDPVAGTIRDQGKIASFSTNGTTTWTVVLETAVTITTGDYIVDVSTITSPALIDCAYNREPMGLLGMIDDGSYVGTYFGNSRTTYPILKAVVRAGSVFSASNYLTLNGIQSMYDIVDQTGNGVIKTMWAHHSIRREYLNLLQTYRRYNDANSLRPDGGFKSAALEADIEYAEKPIKVDRDCPYGMLFGVDDSMMFRYVLSEAEWADDDGKILLRVAGVDAYEARFRVFDNYVNDAPNTCFCLNALALTSPNVIEPIQGL